MSLLGTRVTRNEDPALLTVGGSFVDDLAPSDAVWITFVRSELAHATIRSIDTADAVTMPGVLGVYTNADVGIGDIAPGMPMLNQDMTRPILARDTVRYVGEPVAAVVSETQAQGVDAAEMVVIDYDALTPVLSPIDAATDTVLVDQAAGTNVVTVVPPVGSDDGFEDCEVVVELYMVNQRLAACPIEPRAAAAQWIDGELTEWSTNQNAHGAKRAVSAALGLDPEQVRIITPDVGGSFGAKSGSYPEELVVAQLARLLNRSTRWVETRSENMVGLGHGRGQYMTAKLGGTSDGRLTRYHLDTIKDAGAYPAIGAMLPHLTKLMTSGVYDIKNVSFSGKSVLTNTVPYAAYRGAGRPEATAIIERMVDLFAAKAGIDPAEVRRLNVLSPEQFPITTQTGAAMDSGNYRAALDAALAEANYDRLRSEQAERRASGASRQLGIGVSVYVEITNPIGGPEYGSVTVQPDGSAIALTGSSAHGQGHHTTFAMLVSDTTGIPFDKIEVRHGDTAEVPRGGGTGGSKSLQLGGSAMVGASEALVAKAKDLAADLLEANPSDIVHDAETGNFSVVGTPSVTTSWEDLAKAVVNEAGVEADGDGALSAAFDFQPEGPTFPFGAHVSVVEVDVETGEVDVVRHVACDDAGIMVNPLLVDGQVHGGIAQGIAQALFEEFSYDENGNPITANFMDYGIVSAAELPTFTRIPMETPTPRNPLGAKGIGESGTIGSTPAIQSAVVDAVSHLGVSHIEMPLTSQRVWNAIQEASHG